MTTGPNLTEKIQSAADSHRAGQLNVAGALYQAVLNVAPAQFDALHGLGVVALQQGRPGDAKAFLTKAVAVRQDSADAYYNLGIAWDTLAQYEDAVAAYDAALRLRPAYAPAFCNRGNSLKKMNLALQARQSFEIALVPRVTRTEGTTSSA